LVDRENPRGVLEAFKAIVISCPDVWLMIVGAGPQLNELRLYVKENQIPNIVFVGYIPYVKLEQYLFSADVFIHLAKNEPWGVSPQDALVAGLGLITSDKVGSGVCHLQNDLNRFVVPINDLSTAVERMIELVQHDDPKSLFKLAKDSVLNNFTADALATQWVRRLMDR